MFSSQKVTIFEEEIISGFNIFQLTAFYRQSSVSDGSSRYSLLAPDSKGKVWDGKMISCAYCFSFYMCIILS
jgi:hypothetical protein